MSSTHPPAPLAQTRSTARTGPGYGCGGHCSLHKAAFTCDQGKVPAGTAHTGHSQYLTLSGNELVMDELNYWASLFKVLRAHLTGTKNSDIRRLRKTNTNF